MRFFRDIQGLVYNSYFEVKKKPSTYGLDIVLHQVNVFNTQCLHVNKTNFAKIYLSTMPNVWMLNNHCVLIHHWIYWVGYQNKLYHCFYGNLKFTTWKQLCCIHININVHRQIGFLSIDTWVFCKKYINKTRIRIYIYIWSTCISWHIY